MNLLTPLVNKEEESTSVVCENDTLALRMSVQLLKHGREKETYDSLGWAILLENADPKLFPTSCHADVSGVASG